MSFQQPRPQPYASARACAHAHRTTTMATPPRLVLSGFVPPHKTTATVSCPRLVRSHLVPPHETMTMLSRPHLLVSLLVPPHATTTKVMVSVTTTTPPLSRLTGTTALASHSLARPSSYRLRERVSTRTRPSDDNDKGTPLPRPPYLVPPYATTTMLTNVNRCPTNRQADDTDLSTSCSPHLVFT